MTLRAEQISNYAMEYVGRPLAVAVFFVLLALLWTFALQHIFAYPFIFLFLGAVMCSAWFGGFIAGLISAAMSTFLVEFFFMPPLYSLSVGPQYRSYLTAFIVCAIAITGVSAARKRIESAIRSSRDELEVRVEERTVELQQSNAEIREREHELRLLTEAIPQQIWRTDRTGSIEYANRDLLEYLGKSVDQLAGERFYDIIHPDDVAAVISQWDEARLSTTKLEVKARVQGADGSFRWFILRANPHFQESGALACWYGVHIDVEDQERAQQELLVSQERLSRFSRTLSMAELSAAIAHELNQPLTAILTDAHACRRWLQMQPPNLSRAEATADRIVRDSTRASQVVSRVRSLFSRTDYVREPADMNDIIREMARLLRDEAMRRKIGITLQLSDPLPSVSIDRVQIQQLLLNLAVNGMEAMAAGASIPFLEISTTVSAETEIQVTVRDHGAGLNEESRAHMFEPFFTTKQGGTGMGLAICRSIIEEHDGSIWAESLGDGTAIHFTLRTTA
ncbi:ATP-binding protein [Occallatibacter riparius]|uniref:histidine kinase n=1 Tax=Occallatibacter riparius TaxID=1002689 RepID=A0A9J7BHV2_9BACT|nr:ATP-binding protein [Occallatibacter riparius]UWZ82295.1 ATP-binding protein [Occallatibacter riparius]